MMDRHTMLAKIKQLEKDIKAAKNEAYKQLLEERLAIYRKLLPRARNLQKLNRADKYDLTMGRSTEDRILAAWQNKLGKDVILRDYFDN